MTRVLLTGASGFCGSHVLRHLLTETDWQILCLVSWQHRGEPGRVVDAINGGDRSRVQVITHDLSVPMTSGVLHSIGRADVVMNIASDSHVDRSITHPVPFVANNILLALNMLEYARRTCPGVFLQMGTDEVYGPMLSGELNREWDTVIPSNPYSASKAAQDALATAWWRTYNVPIVLTRTMNLFGPHQSSEKYIPMVIRKILADEVVTIHASPSGEPGSRCWIDVRELADAWLYLTRNHNPARYPETDRPDMFHIAGEQRDNLAVAHTIADIIGKKLKYELVSFHSSRPGHDLAYGLDGSKLARAGWAPKRNLDESLAETVDWYVKNPHWLEV